MNFDDLPRSRKVTAKPVLYQVWIIMVWLRFSESFMFIPQAAQYLHQCLFPYKSLVWYELWWPHEGQRRPISSYLIMRSIFFYFRLNPSKFDIFLTKYDHSIIFLFIFLNGDLWWPRQCQTRLQPDGFHIKFDLY